MTDHGFDRRFGRRMFRRMRLAGLTDVGAEGRVEMLNSGTALVRATCTQLRDTMARGGYVSDEEIERDVCALENDFSLMPSWILWTAWDRRAIDTCQ